MQRLAYAFEEEIVEEADVGYVWMVGNVEVETVNIKLKQAEVPPGLRARGRSHGRLTLRWISSKITATSPTEVQRRTGSRC